MSNNNSKAGKFIACIIFLIVGFSFFGVSKMMYNASDLGKDLSTFETTVGIVDYDISKSDGNTLYYAKATYFVNGYEYEWNSHSGVSPKPSKYSEGSVVDVYYNPSNPSDSAVPELSGADGLMFNIFKYIGIFFIVLGSISLVWKVIKLVFLAGVVGVSAAASKKQQQNYWNNNQGNFNNPNGFQNMGNGLEGLGGTTAQDLNNQQWNNQPQNNNWNNQPQNNNWNNQSQNNNWDNQQNWNNPSQNNNW